MTKIMQSVLNGKSAKIGGGLAIAAALALSLSGCATPADPTMMAVSTQPAAAAFPAPLQHAMCVRTVTGGEETNPLWVSKVGNDDFHAALTSSLTSAGLLGTADACLYPIDVNLLGMSQPMAGFDLTVTSHVNYKVYGKAGQPIVLETISAPYTATMSDSLIAIIRMRMANEGSMRANIGQFFDKLRAADVK